MPLPRWHTAVESGTCPRCKQDLFAREVDIKALTVECWCGAVISIELHGVSTRSVRIVAPPDVSRVPSDPTDLEQRERMKPGTIQRVIDAALEDLLRDGKDWDPVAFGARFGIDPEDATVLRRFGEVERPAILRWLYRKNG